MRRNRPSIKTDARGGPLLHDLFSVRPDAYAYFEAKLHSGDICYGQRDSQSAWMTYPTGTETYDLVEDPLMLNPVVTA